MRVFHRLLSLLLFGSLSRDELGDILSSQTPFIPKGFFSPFFVANLFLKEIFRCSTGVGSMFSQLFQVLPSLRALLNGLWRRKQT